MSGEKNAGDRLQNRLKQVRFNRLLAAAVSIVCGAVLFAWSGTAIAVAFRVFGALLALAGAAAVAAFLVRRDGSLTGAASLVGGAALIVLGFWIYRNPQDPTALFSVVIGIIICVSGVNDIFESFGMARAGFSRWWITLLIGALLTALGVVLIVRPDMLAKILVKMIGAILILNGVTEAAVLYGLRSAVKGCRQSAAAKAASERPAEPAADADAAEETMD